MTDNPMQSAADAEQNRKTYQAVMKFGAEIGTPGCLALGMFFTQLVMANGIGTAFVTGALVFVAVFIVSKLFFSH